MVVVVVISERGTEHQLTTMILDLLLKSTDWKLVVTGLCGRLTPVIEVEARNRPVLKRICTIIDARRPFVVPLANRCLENIMLLQSKR
jgi:hypothetical protein